MDAGIPYIYQVKCRKYNDYFHVIFIGKVDKDRCPLTDTQKIG
jgi:hypothetical protein